MSPEIYSTFNTGICNTINAEFNATASAPGAGILLSPKPGVSTASTLRPLLSPTVECKISYKSQKYNKECNGGAN